MIPMLKIGVIGRRETVMGFKALGLEVFPVVSAQEAHTALKDITRAEQEDEYAIIYFEETFVAGNESEIDRFKEKPTPAVILIPGREGSLGLGSGALKAAVERAVGSDIL